MTSPYTAELVMRKSTSGLQSYNERASFYLSLNIQTSSNGRIRKAKTCVRGSNTMGLYNWRVGTPFTAAFLYHRIHLRGRGRAALDPNHSFHPSTPSATNIPTSVNKAAYSAHSGNLRRLSISVTPSASSGLIRISLIGGARETYDSQSTLGTVTSFLLMGTSSSNSVPSSCGYSIFERPSTY